MNAALSNLSMADLEVVQAELQKDSRDDAYFTEDQAVAYFNTYSSRSITPKTLRHYTMPCNCDLPVREPYGSGYRYHIGNLKKWMASKGVGAVVGGRHGKNR